jgi:hypothetical protein
MLRHVAVFVVFAAPLTAQSVTAIDSAAIVAAELSLGLCQSTVSESRRHPTSTELLRFDVDWLS